MRNKTPMTLTIATILTASTAALTMSNQAFAQDGPSGGGGGGGGNGGAQSGQPINGGNGGDGSIIVTAFGSGALLGQSASNSGHVVHSGLPGQIQTHPIENYARGIGIQIQPFIRNFLIPAAQQHFYGPTGLGIGVPHKNTP
jgi:hypothetical protein